MSRQAVSLGIFNYCIYLFFGVCVVYETLPVGSNYSELLLRKTIFTVAA